MPVAARPSRAFSPPPPSSGSTAGPSQRSNVVTRLAIEGRAKQGADGVSVKIYLMLSIPASTIVPVSTIPLFPEGNVKIVDSQVHPLDNTSVPYNYSTTTSPLVHKAVRAFDLPRRSATSYLTLFPMNSRSIHQSIPSNRSPMNGASAATALDPKYTGHILVSGYHVSFVLPKEYPPKYKIGVSRVNSEDDEAGLAPDTPVKSRRGPVVSDRAVLQFVASIVVWVPFLSQPPKAPYLLDIPTPRCLRNHITLRIFPPTSTSASFASLSSTEEESGAWHLAADPHVTRSATSQSSSSTRSRKHYSGFADDETSDSSNNNTTDEYGVQGTFPSTERVRVRWAAPQKYDVLPTHDGRRQVGVKDVKGEMLCGVRGRDHATGGLRLEVCARITCRNLWHPGVATLLGLDVALDSRECIVLWDRESDGRWTVTGSSGFTGFGVGPPPQPVYRKSSFGTPQLDAPERSLQYGDLPDRMSFPPQPSSSTSLLRAPLPPQQVPDYSFETAQQPALSNTVSSLVSASMASTITLDSKPSHPNSSSDEDPSQADSSPTIPVTVHINMNDLIPPNINSVVLEVTGMIVIMPRPVQEPTVEDRPTPNSELANGPVLPIPVFRVLPAEAEHFITTVRNDADMLNVEVFNAYGDVQDAQARKTVLQRGAHTKLGVDGGRIGLRSLALAPVAKLEARGSRTSPSRPRTPSVSSLYRSPLTYAREREVSLASGIQTTSKPRRDGPLMIPYVLSTVTPLLSSSTGLPATYAVRVFFSAPPGPDMDWIEFGFALPAPRDAGFHPPRTPTHVRRKSPQLDVASVTLEGVSIRFETTMLSAGSPRRGAADHQRTALGVQFEETEGKEWISWLRLHAGGDGGNVEVVYLVSSAGEDNPPEVERVEKSKREESTADDLSMDILLPIFPIPVGRMEVVLEDISGFDMSGSRSTLDHRQSLPAGQKFTHFTLPPLTYSGLSVVSAPIGSPTTRSRKRLSSLTHILPALLTSVLLVYVISLGAEMRNVRETLRSYSIALGSASSWEDSVLEPMTITSTLFKETSFTENGWWPTPDSQLLSPNAEPTRLSSQKELSHIDVQDSSILFEEVSLLPSDDWFKWPALQIGDLLQSLDLPSAFDKLNVLWHLLTYVFHYPLPP